MMSHSGAELTAVWDQLCSVKICVMYSSWFIMAGLSFYWWCCIFMTLCSRHSEYTLTDSFMYFDVILLFLLWLFIHDIMFGKVLC
jgi:hypothetical protein